MQDASREETARLITDARLALLIPRGGPELVRRVRTEAACPVLSHEHGNCHLYVDASADPDMALALAVNGKMARPAVCNALEKLLVHEQLAESFLPRIGEQFAGGPGRHGRLRTSLPDPWATSAGRRTGQDWHEEYLDLR